MMGRDTLILAGLHYGATGAIASCANVAPRIAVDIYEKFQAGTSGTRSGGLRKGQSAGGLCAGLSGFLSRRCQGLNPCV